MFTAFRPSAELGTYLGRTGPVFGQRCSLGRSVEQNLLRSTNAISARPPAVDGDFRQRMFIKWRLMALLRATCGISAASRAKQLKGGCHSGQSRR